MTGYESKNRVKELNKRKSRCHGEFPDYVFLVTMIVDFK